MVRKKEQGKLKKLNNLVSTSVPSRAYALASLGNIKSQRLKNLSFLTSSPSKFKMKQATFVITVAH